MGSPNAHALKLPSRPPAERKSALSERAHDEGALKDQCRTARDRDLLGSTFTIVATDGMSSTITNSM